MRRRTHRSVLWTTATLLAATLLAGAGAACSGHPDDRGHGHEHAAPTDLRSGDDPYWPTVGDTGYAVSHYRIVNTVDLHPATLRTGTTTITATALRPLDRFALDFSLTVDSVRVDGRTADFRTGGSKVVVDPGGRIPRGAVFTATVEYHGDATPDGWQTRGDEILATGEPQVAQWWFPSNDLPRDAATYDTTLNVPTGVQAVSIGRLRDHEISGPRSEWRWVSTERAATYVNFFAVGHFDSTSETKAGVQYRYFVSQRLTERQRKVGMALLRQTPEFVHEEQQDFGPYPFVDGGGLVSGVFDDEDTAMENVTRPTYPRLTDDVDGHRLVVHELAHQWFGDSVRPRRWRDIVLNEAFARWSELRWVSRHGGRSVQQQAKELYDSYPAGSAFWRVDVSNPGPDDLLSQPIYDRGGMMVEALHQRLGEDTFVRFLHAWTDRYAGRSATVDDLERLAADVSGEDLSGFFDAWLHSRTRPTAPDFG